MTRAAWLVSLLCLFVGMAEANAAEEPRMADIEASWDAAYVAIPPTLTGSAPILGTWRSSTVQHFLAEHSGTARVPAVLYLHGCSGFGAEGNAYRHFLSLRGFAFFAPDSLARPERRRNCNPVDHTTGLHGSVSTFRLAELNHALIQIGQLTWVDQDQLFLIGFSEGAAAAARYDGHAFAGLILTAWHCHGGPDNQGIALPPSLPALDIISARDPWYPRLDGRTCARFANGRQSARSLLLEQATHALLTSTDSEVARISRDAILAFLDDAGTAGRLRRQAGRD